MIYYFIMKNQITGERMKRFLTGIMALVMLLSLTACQEEATQKQVFAMDTVMTLAAYGKSGEAALKDAELELYRLEAMLSRTSENSKVSEINGAAGEAVPTEGEIEELLRLAKQYSEKTDGAFDVTIAPVVSAWGFTETAYRVPGPAELEGLLQSVGEEFVEIRDGSVVLAPETRIDLGGIAKGYASDRVAEIFEANGVERGWISLGGNVMAKGTRPDGDPWKVGIQHPEITDQEAFVGMVFLENAYAVTSGGYQRYFDENGRTYHHIIDPATGYPADSGLTSVTVVADLKDGVRNGTMCDALSTALFVMGEEKALEFWRSSTLDFELVLVTEDGRVVVTDGLSDRFAEAEGSGYTYETVS